MSAINYGGPAFPFAATDPSNVNMQAQGMTLRDWFAGMALQGMLSYHNAERGDFHTNGTPIFAALFAYKLADSMIAARDGKEDA